MNKLALPLALLALTGCATCERHPVACALVGSVVLTSVALSARGHHETMASDRLPAICRTNHQACQ